MDSYTLYYSPDSANLVVRMALEEVGADYHAVLVDRARREQRSAHFLQLNPQGLLPVLVHGRRTIFETAAILLYLVDRHAGIGPGMGAGDRGEMYRWLFYLSNTLHTDLRILFHPERYLEEGAATGVLTGMVRQRVLGHLTLLDRQIGNSGSRCLLTGGFSVCDLYLAVCCRWAALYPPGNCIEPGSIRDLPNLRILLQMLQTRDAVARACTAEEIVAPYFLDPVVPKPSTGSVLG